MSTILKADQLAKARFSEAEWRVRVELAALYRLAAVHGWDDLIFGHITARVPGPEHHFLMNPYGLMFEEITASSLVKIDLEGNVLDESEYGINFAGFVIHGALHAANPDAMFVAHFHTHDGIAVSAHREGLLPLNQRSLALIPNLSYHDYEGIALNLDERERLVADMGSNKIMILRNHGTLAWGNTAADAWSGIFRIESACTTQVRTLSIGRDHVLLAPQAAQDDVHRQFTNRKIPVEGKRSSTQLIWEASLRYAHRHSPGFDC
jgi:ribulose-5-phosphate 4-epimerase/fuculose-1-phosphate aldolase